MTPFNWTNLSFSSRWNRRLRYRKASALREKIIKIPSVVNAPVNTMTRVLYLVEDRWMIKQLILYSENDHIALSSIVLVQSWSYNQAGFYEQRQYYCPLCPIFARATILDLDYLVEACPALCSSNHVLKVPSCKSKFEIHCPSGSGANGKYDLKASNWIMDPIVDSQESHSDYLEKACH